MPAVAAAAGLAPPRRAAAAAVATAATVPAEMYSTWWQRSVRTLRRVGFDRDGRYHKRLARSAASTTDYCTFEDVATNDDGENGSTCLSHDGRTSTSAIHFPRLPPPAARGRGAWVSGSTETFSLPKLAERWRGAVVHRRLSLRYNAPPDARRTAAPHALARRRRAAHRHERCGRLATPQVIAEFGRCARSGTGAARPATIGAEFARLRLPSSGASCRAVWEAANWTMRRHGGQISGVDAAIMAPNWFTSGNDEESTRPPFVSPGPIAVWASAIF